MIGKLQQLFFKVKENATAIVFDVKESATKVLLRICKKNIRKRKKKIDKIWKDMYLHRWEDTDCLLCRQG